MSVINFTSAQSEFNIYVRSSLNDSTVLTSHLFYFRTTDRKWKGADRIGEVRGVR